MPHAPTAPTEAPQGDPDGGMVPLRVKIPAVWKRELQAAAGTQAIDLSDLVRIILRGFLRERYDEETQRRLGLI